MARTLSRARIGGQTISAATHSAFARPMAADRALPPPAETRSFFVNLPRLYWWVPGQPGYGDKWPS
jgi:hypothetical protein